VAVISCADDDLVFAHTQPGLSAVVHDQQRMGYEAAKLLHAILEKRPYSDAIELDPVLVAARGSTDWTAVEDPFCEQVLRHIRETVGESRKVSEIARTFHVSESTLIRRFRKHLGHSPVKEISRARLEAAKTLLLTTHNPLAEIALDCGFSGQPHFQREFKKATGMTPGQIRRQHGIG